eukprot:3302407-Rhodomonas_salina.1
MNRGTLSCSVDGLLRLASRGRGNLHLLQRPGRRQMHWQRTARRCVDGPSCTRRSCRNLSHIIALSRCAGTPTRVQDPAAAASPFLGVWRATKFASTNLDFS